MVGTRPEVIKMAPLFRKIEASPDLEGIFCVTGQHSELLLQALEDFGIKPSLNLNLMTTNQTLGELSARLISGVTDIINSFKPNLILVHGDTTTALCSALAAFYSRITVGHVEAGLRTHDIWSPFPEEANRQIISRLAELHFAPTLEAKENLLAEGIKSEQIVVTGNTSVDALIEVSTTMPDSALTSISEIRVALGQTNQNLPNKNLVLVTSHRRENFGRGMEEISTFLQEFTEENPDLKVLFPVHPNPHVRDYIAERLSKNEQILLTEPLSFPTLIHFIRESKFVITDSGGIQEEAVSLGKNVLVTREFTERPEGISTGLLEVVGTDPRALKESAQRLLIKLDSYGKEPDISESPYGDGKACERIVQTLEGKQAPPWVPKKRSIT